MIKRNGINKTRKNEPMMMAMLHLETATLSLSFFCCFACSSRFFKFNSHQHRHCKGPKNLQKISDRCEAKISKQKNFFVWRLKEKKVSLCIERRLGPSRRRREQTRKTRKNLELTICSVVGVIVRRSQAAIYHLFHLLESFSLLERLRARTRHLSW